MSKRFTETEKWKDPWFCELNETQKLFWVYLVDNCDHAGIWQVNWPLVRFHIKGYKHDHTKFTDRILYISDNKWFIKKFIDFQYNGKLNPENRTHKSVLDILEKEGAYKGLTSPTGGCKGTGTVLGTGSDKEVKEEIIRDKFLTSVLLYKEEHAKLVERFGEEGTKQRIYDLNNYMCSVKGAEKRYKSHYHTILSWERRHERQNKP